MIGLQQENFFREKSSFVFLVFSFCFRFYQLLLGAIERQQKTTTVAAVF